VVLSEGGRIGHHGWAGVRGRLPNVCADTFMVMRNHVHRIIPIDDDPCGRGHPALREEPHIVRPSGVTPPLRQEPHIVGPTVTPPLPHLERGDRLRRQRDVQAIAGQRCRCERLWADPLRLVESVVSVHRLRGENAAVHGSGLETGEAT
jgi:hypothetical protein